MNEIMFKKLFERIPELEVCKDSIEESFLLLEKCYSNNGFVFICGNGGSAADSEHIVGELMKSFLIERTINKQDAEKIKLCFPEEGEYLVKNLQGALPAVSLVSQCAISSAYANDIAADMVYAQQFYGYAKSGDILIALSTSGNSKNVINAVKVAKSMNIKTIGMTGQKGGELKNLCDVIISVPSNDIQIIQEYHLPIYHALCAQIEVRFFKT